MDGYQARALSRREFLAVTGAVGVAGWLTPRTQFGQATITPSEADGPVQQFRRVAATSPVTVQPVRGGVSVLMGSGCNVVSFMHGKSVTLVDSGLVGSKVSAAVATFTSAPIKHLINTHWHFDHTDANQWMHERGAKIVAHENTRKDLSSNTHVQDWFDFTFPAAPAAALPTTVFAKAHGLHVDGHHIALESYVPAHTDSDISVYFADADVLCVGDTWWNNIYPFIDYATGGSIDGMIGAADQTLARATSKTIIVPGHGAPGGIAELKTYRDMLSTIRDRVAQLKRQGKNVAQTVAAKPTASFDSAFGGALIDPELFTRLIYKGV